MGYVSITSLASGELLYDSRIEDLSTEDRWYIHWLGQMARQSDTPALRLKFLDLRRVALDRMERERLDREFGAFNPDQIHFTENDLQRRTK